MKPSLITFTSCVSDLSYAGHPSKDENFIDFSNRKVLWPETKLDWRSPNTDTVKTLIHLKEMLKSYEQPVTWVINDGEYMNLNGTLPYLKEYQKNGDSILITYEIVQRPSPVNRKNIEEVLRYAEQKCTEAGLHIDGIWSLKFIKSDVEAIIKLSKKFPWARNLAGACWLQEGQIDDSGWRGCPFGPYYPALNNIRGCSLPNENGNLVMMQWLTRDFATGIQLDRIASYGLDPADPAKSETGGFGDESVAGEYLGDVALQTVQNVSDNAPNIVRIHEEIRGYYDEGHDKDIIIHKIYQALRNAEKDCIKTTLKEAFDIFRRENPNGNNSYLYSGTTLDKRFLKDNIMLYEDGSCQIHFKRSLGNYPYRIYDYSKLGYGISDNDYYPVTIFPVLPLELKRVSCGIEIGFTVPERCSDGSIYALAIWNEPELKFTKSDFEVKHVKSHDGNHVLLFRLEKGRHFIKLKK